MKDEWAENRMADFNLWAAGAGALTTGKASLDHRLKTDPQTHRIVTNLVLILEALVEDCITNVTRMAAFAFQYPSPANSA